MISVRSWRSIGWMLLMRLNNLEKWFILNPRAYRLDRQSCAKEKDYGVENEKWICIRGNKTTAHARDLATSSLALEALEQYRTQSPQVLCPAVDQQERLWGTEILKRRISAVKQWKPLRGSQ